MSGRWYLRTVLPSTVSWAFTSTQSKAAALVVGGDSLDVGAAAVAGKGVEHVLAQRSSDSSKERARKPAMASGPRWVPRSQLLHSWSLCRGGPV